jgi:hypothetical protein
VISTQRDGNDDNDRAIVNGPVPARNSMRQPSFFNLDVRLMKSFGAPGRCKLGMRVHV